MESHCIQYRDTGAFTDAVISYLNGNAELSPFYSHPPTIAGFRDLLASKKQPEGRELLATVLEEQYHTLSVHDKVRDNIAALRNENTFTVTTGHQLAIFTGPLYFIYKIVTAINLAKELAATFPGKNFVPVYWMATEDHDFAEINHLTIGGETLNWDQDQRGATGRISTESIKGVVERYIALLGTGDLALSLGAIIENAYIRQPDLSGAARALVNSLFDKYGLVIIDADDQRLKQQFEPFITRDILEQNSFREISVSSVDLGKAGYKPQVNAREINFFYLRDGLRDRITFENGRYYILNSEISFTEEDIRKEIKNHPERFSPNVMLRPLYQEIILPNLAYIGGGAELVYWLQLKKMFDFYQVDYPVLVLRNSAVIIEETLNKELAALGLTYCDLFDVPDDLAKKFALKTTVNNLSAERERQEISAVFEKLKQRLSGIDTTLVPSAAAIEARLKHAFGNLEKKMLKAEKRNFDKQLFRLMTLREKAFPNGSLQERVENFGLYYSTYGEAFIDHLIKHFKPLDFTFTILAENSADQHARADS